MTELQWIILAADAAITLFASLNSLALGRLGRMKSQKRQPGIAYPPLTVVVTAHNQALELKKHLPALLLQDYPADFEVVVVDMASSDETIPMLEKMEEEYPCLRHTFTPLTARDISLERLALTLGIRSASYSWTILLHAGCRPASPYWLRRMGDAMLTSNDTRIVVAPVCPDQSDKADEYATLWRELLWLSYAARHGAYRTGECNVAYDRNLFMQHHGFASHSLLAGGATDIMVNHHSTKRNTAASIRPESHSLYPASQGEGCRRHVYGNAPPSQKPPSLQAPVRHGGNSIARKRGNGNGRLGMDGAARPMVAGGCRPAATAHPLGHIPQGIRAFGYGIGHPAATSAEPFTRLAYPLRRRAFVDTPQADGQQGLPQEICIKQPIKIHNAKYSLYRMVS